MDGLGLSRSAKVFGRPRVMDKSNVVGFSVENRKQNATDSWNSA